MASGPYHQQVFEAIKQTAGFGAGLGLLAGIFTITSGTAFFMAPAVFYLLATTAVGALIGGGTGLAFGSIGNMPIFSRDSSDRQARADRQALQELVTQSRSYERAETPVMSVAAEMPIRVTDDHAVSELARRAEQTVNIGR